MSEYIPSEVEIDQLLATAKAQILGGKPQLFDVIQQLVQKSNEELTYDRLMHELATIGITARFVRERLLSAGITKDVILKCSKIEDLKL